MSDLSANLQKIIVDLKSLVNPIIIPEANKNDPIAYYLSELNKLNNELAEGYSKQAEVVAKIGSILKMLYQEMMKARQLASVQIPGAVGSNVQNPASNSTGSTEKASPETAPKS